MPAPRAVALAAAAVLSLPFHASADPLAPTAQCTFGDAYKLISYTGIAYTTGPVVPRRLTLVCSVDNGYDRHVTRQSAEGPFVALASVGATSTADPPRVCSTASAEYANGYVATTSHCRLLGEMR